MSAAFVQGAQGETDLGLSASTASINTTTGNTLILSVFMNNYMGGALVSVLDNDGGPNPSQDAYSDGLGAYPQLYIFSKTNITGKSGYVATVTVNTTMYLGITVEEVSGLATSSALDKVASQSGNAYSTTTAALAQNNEWAFGVAGQIQGSPWSITSGGWTLDQSMTFFGGYPFMLTGYKYVTDGAAQTYSVSSSGYGETIALATYKEATGGGGINMAVAAHYYNQIRR